MRARPVSLNPRGAVIQRNGGDAHPTRISSTEVSQAGLAYGALYVQTVESSSGNSADLAGIRCREVVTGGARNDLNIGFPRIEREFNLSAQGRYNDRIWTQKAVIDGQVAQINEGSLPAVMETPQELFWKERNSNTWHKFADLTIEIRIDRNLHGQLRVYTELNDQMAAEDYTGPAPLADEEDDDDQQLDQNDFNYHDHQPNELEYDAMDHEALGY
jgi:hypothetical protein